MVRKLILKSMLLCVIAVSSHGTLAFADDKYDYVKMMSLKVGSAQAEVNGDVRHMDGVPFLRNGSVMVPLREIGEMLGAVVQWNPDIRRATILLEDKCIEMPLDSNFFALNGVAHHMESSAVIHNGRVFVPIRTVGESMGCVVYYEAESKSIFLHRITTKGWVVSIIRGNEYLHPQNYTIEVHDDADSLRIISPRRSVMELNQRTQTPYDARNNVRERYLSEGWVYNTQFYKNDKNVNDGVQLVFHERAENGTDNICYVFVTPHEKGSLIAELILERSADDWDTRVMNLVLNSIKQQK